MNSERRRGKMCRCLSLRGYIMPSSFRLFKDCGFNHIAERIACRCVFVFFNNKDERSRRVINDDLFNGIAFYSAADIIGNELSIFVFLVLFSTTVYSSFVWKSLKKSVSLPAVASVWAYSIRPCRVSEIFHLLNAA